MIDGWVLWLVLGGLAIGVFATWLLLLRLPREEDDIAAPERRHEAEWIGAIIERHGGVAPRPFVEEVLDLHQAYLRSPRAAADAPMGLPAAAAPPAVTYALPAAPRPPAQAAPPGAPLPPVQAAPPARAPAPPPGAPAPPPARPTQPPRSR